MKLGAVVIPARYQSSRFPGKPLVDLNGIPMLQHVYNRCCEAVGFENVYVATDDKRIADVVKSFDGQVIITSSICLTGTDRIVEANAVLQLDFIVNVQGDEPMVNPNDIKAVYDRMTKNTDNVLNCYCDIEPNEVLMPSVPKVVVSKSGRLIYMSRGPCPFNKSGVNQAKYKQVCIYGFGRQHLEIFSQNPGKTFNEDIEDIEILRFLDLDVHVDMLKVSKGGIAVDTPHDLSRVKLLLKE